MDTNLSSLKASIFARPNLISTGWRRMECLYTVQADSQCSWEKAGLSILGRSAKARNSALGKMRFDPEPGTTTNA